jgi:hypothetical protein
MKLKSARAPLVHMAIATAVAATAAIALGSPGSAARVSQASEQDSNQVLEWNRIFVETLIATNTPNSSSQRLGAIVHTAIFDAYNGIERRYTSIFVRNVDGNGEPSSLRERHAEQRSSLPRTRRSPACFPLGSNS